MRGDSIQRSVAGKRRGVKTPQGGVNKVYAVQAWPHARDTGECPAKAKSHRRRYKEIVGSSTA